MLMCGVLLSDGGVDGWRDIQLNAHRALLFLLHIGWGRMKAGEGIQLNAHRDSIFENKMKINQAVAS